MKRSKILIPTLSALAVTPAIALVGCNQSSSEQNILDCIIKPTELVETPIDDFAKAYKDMTTEDKNNELIYDAFNVFNEKAIDDNSKSFTSLWSKEHEGSFKVNIAECNVVLKDGKYLATLRGYISYIFEKEHKFKYRETNITMKQNDYVMVTYEFLNRPVIVEDFYFTIIPESFPGACIGFMKIKYNSGQQDVIIPFDLMTTNDSVPKNSKNWVKK